MQSSVPDMGPGDPELDVYNSPAQLAGDLNVSLLGALQRQPRLAGKALQLEALIEPGKPYDGIVDRIELLSGRIPLRLMGCVGLSDDAAPYRLAANLAARLVGHGQTVTVVDANLERATLIGPPDAPREGLMDMLLYGCSYEAAARVSSVERLQTIFLGSHPWSGEPIHTDDWDRVLTALRHHSDLTMVVASTDLEPMTLAVLARRLDSIVLAYGLEETGRDAIRRSYLSLWDMDAPILGVVTEGRLDESTPPPSAATENDEANRPGAPVTGSGPPVLSVDWAKKFWDPAGEDQLEFESGSEVVIRDGDTASTAPVEDAASFWNTEVERILDLARSVGTGGEQDDKDDKDEAEQAAADSAAAETGGDGVAAVRSADDASPDEAGADAAADDTAADEAGADDTAADDTAADEAGADDTGADAAADDTAADEVGADDTGADAAGADDTGADAAGADDTGADAAGADDTGADEADSHDTLGVTQLEMPPVPGPGDRAVAEPDAVDLPAMPAMPDMDDMPQESDLAGGIEVSARYDDMASTGGKQEGLSLAEQVEERLAELMNELAPAERSDSLAPEAADMNRGGPAGGEHAGHPAECEEAEMVASAGGETESGSIPERISDEEEPPADAVIDELLGDLLASPDQRCSWPSPRTAGAGTAGEEITAMDEPAGESSANQPVVEAAPAARTAPETNDLGTDSFGDEEDEDVPVMSGRTPWRVLLVGGLLGCVAVLFWAWRTDIIRLEQWVPGTGLQVEQVTDGDAGTLDVASERGVIDGQETGGAGDPALAIEVAERIGGAADGPDETSTASMTLGAVSTAPTGDERAAATDAAPGATAAAGGMARTDQLERIDDSPVRVAAAAPPGDGTPTTPPITSPLASPAAAKPELPITGSSSTGTASGADAGTVGGTDAGTVGGTDAGTPEAPAAEAAPQSELVPDHPYAAHVSSYRSFTRAETDGQRFTRAGYPVQIVETDLGEKGTWYRVYVGRYATVAEAREVAARIVADQLSDFAQAKRVRR